MLTERWATLRALQWISKACRQELGQVVALGLSDEQAQAIGAALAANPLLSPVERPRAKQKIGTFMCQCGCGEAFTVEWKTRRPRYKNVRHKRQAEYKRARARQDVPALNKEWIPGFGED